MLPHSSVLWRKTRTCHQALQLCRSRGAAKKPTSAQLDAFRARLRERLFEEGAAQHRAALLGRLARGEAADGRGGDAEALAIVGHLLYEGLLFHHKQFTLAISGLAKRGLWEAACSLLAEMRDRELAPNPISYNAASNACRKGQAWAQALAVFQDMRSCAVHPDVVSFSTVVAACEKASHWQGALALFWHLRQADLQPDQQSVSAAIGACARGACWELAMHLLGHAGLREGRPDLVCHNAGIRACGSGMEWTMGLAVLAALQARGPQPDAVSYNSTISACAAASEWEQAVRLFTDMGCRLIRRTAVTYNAAMDAHFRGGRGWEESWALYEEMRDFAVEPTVVTFGALVASLTPELRWREALMLMADTGTKGLKLDGKAAGAVVALLGASGQFRYALERYRDSIDQRLLPSPWSSSDRGALDLHGHVVQVALVVVLAVLQDMVVQPQGRYSHDPRRNLLVITGKGSELVPALDAFLGEGFDPPLDFWPAPEFANPGRWVIPSSSLLSWVEARPRRSAVVSSDPMRGPGS